MKLRKWYRKPGKEGPMRLNNLCGITLIVFLTMGCSVTYRAEIYPIPPYLQVNEFQFTKAAEENNAENLLVIRDKKLAQGYVRNWQEHEKHSEVYVGG